jgi:hypothetical protein
VHRTAWHPIVADVLSQILPPARGYEVIAELQLNYQPLRADYVVIRKDRLAQPASSVMAPLTRLLGPCNLIELTGPTSTLQADDFRWILVYAPLLCIKLRISDPQEVRLFTVAGRLTGEFQQQAERYRGTFHPVEAGVHEVRGLDHVLYCIETEVAGDPILRLLSPRFLKDPVGLFGLLSEEEKAIFWMIHERIEQFRKDPQTALKYPDWKEIAMTEQEFTDRFLARLSPEERLKGLPPEELLKRVPPEERLKGLSPEERLKGLSPEEMARLRALLSQ